MAVTFDTFKSKVLGDSREHWPRLRDPSVLNGSKDRRGQWLRDVWPPIDPEYVRLDSLLLQNSRRTYNEILRPIRQRVYKDKYCT